MAGALRGEPGGIFGLVDLIDEHRGALEYDWRTRFHLGLDAIPHVVGFDEAIRLVQVLRADPSSALAASVEKWPHPVTRESVVLMDLYDLVHQAVAKKPKPYPRPWGKRIGRRTTDTSSFSQDAVKALLERHRNGINTDGGDSDV